MMHQTLADPAMHFGWYWDRPWGDSKLSAFGVKQCTVLADCFSLFSHLTDEVLPSAVIAASDLQTPLMKICTFLLNEISLLLIKRKSSWKNPRVVSCWVSGSEVVAQCCLKSFFKLHDSPLPDWPFHPLLLTEVHSWQPGPLISKVRHPVMDWPCCELWAPTTLACFAWALMFLPKDEVRETRVPSWFDSHLDHLV